MSQNEMKGLMFKMEDDPRITRVGRFIRKTSIDELPQFWNVLRGDMSLVGTRPPTVDEFEQYEAKHRCRLSMTPGLTGMWQISGRSDVKDFDEVVKLDMQYIDNWSILKDIKILILSGYDEFDYAKAAIKLGVTEYLLKPVSASKLLDSLRGVSGLIRQERGEKELLMRYSEEMGANTEHEKHKFFTQLVSGELSMAEAIETGKPYRGTAKTQMKLGVDVLPKFNRDTTDRNRTSPFAFTGNKFEFRMLGSSNSIACANMMLNSAVAESLKIYADRLEGAEDFESTLHEMIRKTIKDHKKIIFNGNGYDEAWIKEAVENRGLLNYRTTPDCMPHLLDQKNVDMLTGHKVFSEAELKSRCEIMLDNYCKTVLIEANTMVDMAKTDILPAVEAYAYEVARTAAAKRAVDENLACRYESGLVRKLSELTDGIAERAGKLEEVVASLQEIGDVIGQSEFIRDVVLNTMEDLRSVCDEAEQVTAKKYWPYPSYGDLLFGVR